MKIIKDCFRAFLVKKAKFTSIEEYPIIEKWMIPSIPPKDILPFNKALSYKGNKKGVYVCTYSPDESFERIRRNPKRYLKILQSFEGIIGFDYSVHTDMPLIVQKSQMNDNLSYSYYYASQSIKLIPNVRYGVDETSEEFLNAIPKNSMISIGTHGFSKYSYQKHEWYCFISNLIEKINPSFIVIYGPHISKSVDKLLENIPHKYYDSWLKTDKIRRGSKYEY